MTSEQRAGAPWPGVGFLIRGLGYIADQADACETTASVPKAGASRPSVATPSGQRRGPGDSSRASGRSSRTGGLVSISN